MLLLCLMLLGAGSVASFNALIDPMWFFTHAHPLNRVQPNIDERAQKSNWLQARRGRFDAVLFGSSRSTYIDQRDFAPVRLFNYAVNAMWPKEYRPYLDHFTAVNGHAPNLVVLGVDDFGSQNQIYGEWKSPESYRATTGDVRYLTSSLLSLDLLRRSLLTSAASTGLLNQIDQLDYYDRHNIRHFRRTVDPRFRATRILHDLEGFYSRFRYEFIYNNELPLIWKQMREAYPETRFLVFTTPIAEPLFALLVRDGRLDVYERWLTDLTVIFGGVWDFMGVNSVTGDLSNYRDAQHFHPRIGRLIADRLLQRPVAARHADFGRWVTPDNLAEHLAFIRSQIPCLDPDPLGTARARAVHAAGATLPLVEPEPVIWAGGSCRYADASGATK